MTLDTYTIYGTLAVLILLIVWIVRLEIVLRKLLGAKSGTLDESISALRKDVDRLKQYADASAKHFDTVDKKLVKTISGNETVRFNPFKGDGSGSNQSFATALVNADGDGVIISSLYSRDHVSVFSKPVKNMKSDYELSAEERSALQKAKESIV